MLSELIMAGVMVGALLVLLGTWRIGRQVVLTSLRHPLETSVIHISEAPNKKSSHVEVRVTKEEDHDRAHVDQNLAVG